MSDAASHLPARSPQSDPTTPASSGIATPKTQGARKHITVLFADIAGSTQLFSNMDPEDASAVLAGIMSTLSEPIQQSGGVVAKVMGDGLFAVFGAPLAQENHAFRACYAACELQRLADSLPMVENQPVRLRVGLNSGTALVTMTGEELDAIGDVVNQASHLEASAPVGGVLVSASTLRLAGTPVKVEHMDVPSAGKSNATDAFRLLSCGDPHESLALGTGDIRFPYVGRRRERAYLRAALDDLREGRGDVVAIIGDAGLGKTRLLAEALASFAVEHISKHTVTCRLTDRTVPNALIKQIAFSMLDLQQAEMSRISQKRISEKLSLIEPGLIDASIALEWLIGDDFGSLETEAVEKLRRQALAAIKELLHRSAANRPMVLVIDDYHWADPSSRDFVTQLEILCGTVPLLIITASRDVETPSLSSSAAQQVIRLTQLPVSDASDLLDSVFVESNVPARLHEQIVKSAQGNPRFLVEFARMVQDEARAISKSEAANLEEIAVPASVADLFEERIDHLPDAARALLQLVVAYEQNLTVSTAAQISESDATSIRSNLQTLVEAGFVRETAFVPETTVIVSNPIVAEAAYRPLLRQERRRLHARICDYALKQPYEAVPPRLIARQAFRAERFALAAESYFTAGRLALERLAYGESVHLLKLALRANGQAQAPDRETDELGVDIRLSLREALFASAAFEEIHPILEEAQQLAERLGEDRKLLMVNRHIVGNLLSIGRLEESLPRAQALVAEAEETQDDKEASEARFVLTQVLASLGQYAEAEAEARVILDFAASQSAEITTDKSAVPIALARMWAIWCASEQGRFEDVMPLVFECQAILSSNEAPFFRILAGIGTGLFWLRYGDCVLAVDTFRSVLPLTEFEATGAWFPSVASPLGLGLARLDHLNKALPLLKKAVNKSTYRGGTGRSLRLTHLAECQLLMGDVDQAYATVREALMLSERTKEAGARAYALQTMSSCLLSQEKRNEAANSIAEAMELAKELNMCPLQADLEALNQKLIQ